MHRIIGRLENNDTQAKGPEIARPDKFDGSDPSKLRSFLTSCRLVFLNQPRKFNIDRSRILFVGSYLSGVASEWFLPKIQAIDDDALSDYESFEEELTAIFGEPDEQQAHERKLSQLRMRESDKAQIYITKFKKHAIMLNWDDQALKFHFRQGLPDRILRALALREKDPRTYTGLMEVVLNIDHQYWRLEEERKARAGRGSETSSGDRRPGTSGFAGASRGGSGSGYRSSSDNSYRRTPSVANYRPASASAGRGGFRNNNRLPSRSPSVVPRANNLDRQLRSDGTLKGDERQRRIDQRLCLYCGAAGHQLADCQTKPRDIRAGTQSRQNTPSVSRPSGSGNA